MATISAMPVPRPPSTEYSGSSWPRILMLPGPFQGRSASGRLTRSVATDTWAIVNDSIAPNA